MKWGRKTRSVAEGSCSTQQHTGPWLPSSSFLLFILSPSIGTGPSVENGVNIGGESTEMAQS